MPIQSYSTSSQTSFQIEPTRSYACQQPFQIERARSYAYATLFHTEPIGSHRMEREGTGSDMRPQQAASHRSCETHGKERQATASGSHGKQREQHFDQRGRPSSMLNVSQARHMKVTNPKAYTARSTMVATRIRTQSKRFPILVDLETMPQKRYHNQPTFPPMLQCRATTKPMLPSY